MGRVFMVIIKPTWQLAHDDRCAREIRHPRVLSLERLHKGFCHAIAFRTIGRRRTHIQAEPTTARDRLPGTKARAIVTEPLHRRGHTSGGAESCLDTLDHQVAYKRSIHAASGGHLADRFSVTRIEAKRHMHAVAIPALNREDVRTPARIALRRAHATVVRAMRPSRVPLQQEVLRLHHPIDPFPIDRCVADLPHGPLQKGGAPRVPVRRARIRHRLDHREEPRIIGLAHALARQRVRGRRPESRAHAGTGHPQAPSHRSHSKPSTPRNGCREISVFSRPRRIAAFRISFSTVF